MSCYCLSFCVILYLSFISVQSVSLIAPKIPSFQFSNKLSTAFGNFQKTLSKHQSKLKAKSQDIDFSEYNFENLIENGPIPPSERNFLINGWRWHTISVIRDIDRFVSVMRKLRNFYENDSEIKNNKLTNANIIPLKCFDFVCGFNWKALRRVETELFFPWLKSMISSDNASKAEAVDYLFANVLRQHSSIIVLTSKLSDLCNNFKASNDITYIGGNNEFKIKQRLENIQSIEDTLQSMKKCALDIQNIQESVFVPYIAAHVNKREQEKFNSKVIKRLGLLDSQVHIVSMFEAIKEQPIEVTRFKNQIPRIAQTLIPIWKSRLYNSKAQFLNDSIFI